MIDILIRLLILLFLGFFGIDSEVSQPAPLPPQETFESLTLIDSVEASVLESFPAQIQLHVRGSQPDGCDYPVQVREVRNGNTVSVTIYREMPLAVVCPAMLVMYEETITLEGGFEPGTYTIDVNGFTIEVTV